MAPAVKPSWPFPEHQFGLFTAAAFLKSLLWQPGLPQGCWLQLALHFKATQVWEASISQVTLCIIFQARASPPKACTLGKASSLIDRQQLICLTQNCGGFEFSAK